MSQDKPEVLGFDAHCTKELGLDKLEPLVAAHKKLNFVSDLFDRSPSLHMLERFEEAQDAFLALQDKAVKANRRARKYEASRPVGAMRPYDGIENKSGWVYQGHKRAWVDQRSLAPNSASKAVEYARWIAARDGRPGATGEGVAFFEHVEWSGFASGVYVATAVTFAGGACIELPNWNYDPTRPAVDLDAPCEAVDERELEAA